MRMYELSEAAMMEANIDNVRMIRLAVWGSGDELKRLEKAAPASQKKERLT